MSNQDLHQMRMNTEADVSYTVVPNPLPSSQEAAPYLGRTHVSGSYTQDDVAREMAAMPGSQFDVEAIKRVWNATGNYVIDHMAEDQRPYDLGFVKLRPAISGTFPTADAPFDPERNKLYVAATPPDEIRNALAGDSPTKEGASTVIPEVSNVSWNKRKMTIKSGEPFEIVGSQLTLIVGDERAELIPPHGDPVAVALDQIEDGVWQRISGRLAQPVDACEGATLKLWTHGLDSTSQLFELKKSSITVLAGETPPAAPDITDAYSENSEVDHTDIDGNSAFIIEGEHLQGASVAFQYKNYGVWSDPSSPTEEDMDREEGEIHVHQDWLGSLLGEGDWDLGEGDEVKITVTNSAGSDSVIRTVVWAS